MSYDMPITLIFCDKGHLYSAGKMELYRPKPSAQTDQKSSSLATKEIEDSDDEEMMGPSEDEKAIGPH